MKKIIITLAFTGCTLAYGQTIQLDNANLRIYTGGTAMGTFFAAGLGIGSQTATGSGVEAVGIGTFNEASASKSIAIGNYVKATNAMAITLGSGYSTTHLVNNITSSLMVGFNSNIPTLFVGPGSGLNTIGKVGIGTTNPTGDFQLMRPTAASMYISSSSANDAKLYVSNSLLSYTFGITNAGMGQIAEGTNPLISFMHGNVGIGTTCLPAGYGYKLSVDGRIICEEVKVKLSNSTGCWPDYVFDENYALPKLDELEQQIKRDKHLPGFMSASQIEAEGLELAETVKLQQEKIEELTLYIIELNKRMMELEKK